METEYTERGFNTESVNSLLEEMGAEFKYKPLSHGMDVLFSLIHIQHERITKLEEKLHDLSQ